MKFPKEDFKNGKGMEREVAVSAGGARKGLFKLSAW
jgi:hypothetical protein